MYYKNIMIVNDTTSWSITLEASIMLFVSSIVLLDSSIRSLENIYFQ